MKRLRILTGQHVGAHLDLSQGSHVIGAHSDADVVITDWSFAPVLLCVSGESVTASWQETPPADAEGAGRKPVERSMVLAELAPREFDGIVLCVGPRKRPWPNDVQLLSAVFSPPRKSVVRWVREGPFARLLPWLFTAAMAASIGLLWPGFEARSQSVPEPTLEEARVILQRALDKVSPGELTASIELRTIYVNGLVEDGQHAAAARATLAAARVPYTVVSRFAVATDIAETIRGAAGLMNASVRHNGGGVFSVVADVTDERAARASIDRIGADLSPVVKTINASLSKTLGNDPMGPILSRMDQDRLSVVQTRDGVKHIAMAGALLEVDLNDSAPVSEIPAALAASARPGTTSDSPALPRKGKTP
ncbi:hypothetical protein [Variovorax sp. 770b2]|uniref:hypothetical protein n=1 Tax=Variovorax sp. 770b2 TaxID=1566271 RepID=UPI0008E919A3|nr:hypothetical protein [Variovorax sp. 770b2]SFQ04324.1 type III secretion protein D [Variovorax sp. 770b2]